MSNDGIRKVVVYVAGGYHPIAPHVTMLRHLASPRDLRGTHAVSSPSLRAYYR